jgi:hypothetical protein
VRSTRVVAAIVAAVVAAVGTWAGVSVARHATSSDAKRKANSSPRATPSGYYVLFPDGPRGYDGRGRAILDADSNLPEGTLVDLDFFSADMGTQARGVVANERIELRVANASCHETEVGLIGTDMQIVVTARPEYPHLGSMPIGGSPGRQPSPVLQPANVAAVLGLHFEQLIGDQVRVVEGKKMLEARQAYELPAETCTSKLLYTGNGSFEQVPIDHPMALPTGPFPQPPFTSCPDKNGARQVEAGDARDANEIALAFDVAITDGDAGTLRRLADASVSSFEGWISTGLPEPELWTDVPSGNYFPTVPPGCGSLVAMRTWGVTLAKSGGDPDPPLITYLLILRPGGWRVWGQLPEDGR